MTKKKSAKPVPLSHSNEGAHATKKAAKDPNVYIAKKSK